ncbi:MAG: hypothetical protein IPM82_18200 [Saprospiraceae bacterium]|nr:hypothetical protein [Saprospiraceae bacterium]
MKTVQFRKSQNNQGRWRLVLALRHAVDLMVQGQSEAISETPHEGSSLLAALDGRREIWWV